MIEKYLSKDMCLQKKNKKLQIIVVVNYWQNLYNSTKLKYHKLTNFLDNTPNQPTRFRTKKMS